MRLQIALNHIRNSIRLITLVIMFTAVVVATAAGFAHSYAGLYDWGLAHKLTGWKADTFPLLVDMFILVGELGLFLIALDGLRIRRSITAWMDITIPSAVIAAGWGASLWFNINHLSDATQDDKVTFAIPPIAAMVGLMILLRTVHRYAARLESANAAPVPVPPVVPEPVPTSVVAPTEPAPAVRMAPVPLTQWHIVGMGIFRAGTEHRTVWPELAPEPVPVRHLNGTRDHETVPSLSPAAGNGVVSESETVRVLPEYIRNGFIMDSPETAAEGREWVPVRDVQPVSGSPTAATSEPHTESPTTDERKQKGLTYCADFHAVTGKLPAQRPLAAHLGMKNRDLAREILTHAKEMISDGTIKHYLSEATSATGQPQG